jgi:hypothetical protein
VTDPEVRTEGNPAAEVEAVEASTRRRVRSGYMAGGALVLAAVLLGGWALANSPGAVQGEIATPAETSSTSPSATPNGSPSATPSASASTSAPTDAVPGQTEPSPAAEEPALPVIEWFRAAEVEVACADDRTATVPLSFDWSSSGATDAWVGVGTTDASLQPLANVPPTADAYADVAFECANEEQLFTLTVRGPGGTVSSSVTVTRTLL